MLFHYLSYETLPEAEAAQEWVWSHIEDLEMRGGDRIQPESIPQGDLYLGGNFVYVFHTTERLSLDTLALLQEEVPTCGHSVNSPHFYW